MSTYKLDDFYEPTLSNSLQEFFGDSYQFYGQLFPSQIVPLCLNLEDGSVWQLGPQLSLYNLLEESPCEGKCVI